MFNPIAFDEEYDRELLEGSYDALQHKDQLEIIVDDATLSIQNLFRYIFPHGKFYIAQCLFNFGYPTSNRGTFVEHKYDFQIVGFAELNVDLGNTFMRSETRTDKIVGKLFGNDIDFDGTATFNEKYYLVSDKKESLANCFDRHFFNTIAKYDNLLLRVKNKQMFITFDRRQLYCTNFHSVINF